jgi:hypothetical protein
VRRGLTCDSVACCAPRSCYMWTGWIVNTCMPPLRSWTIREHRLAPFRCSARQGGSGAWCVNTTSSQPRVCHCSSTALNASSMPTHAVLHAVWHNP